MEYEVFHDLNNYLPWEDLYPALISLKKCIKSFESGFSLLHEYARFWHIRTGLQVKCESNVSYKFTGGDQILGKAVVYIY